MSSTESSKIWLRRVLLTQIVLVLIGVVFSLFLEFRGNLMERSFGIITSPFFGFASQIDILLLVQLSPIITLFGGILGFTGLILMPGMLITYFFHDEMHILNRVLFGTFLSLLLIFLPTAYFLLIGFASTPTFLVIPLVLALTIYIVNPTVLKSYKEDLGNLWNLFRQDVSSRRHTWFWVGILFIVVVRVALFSFTDSYSSDSISYVGYVDAIINGTFLTGYTFVHPIGYALFSMPFVWLVGEPTWGLALSSWILTFVALCGAVPLIERLGQYWPTERKPPIRVLVLALFSVPWLTILMSSILHESVLLFLTIVGTGAIGARIKHSEVILGLATGIAYLVRPTHALMYFSFMLIPLWENRKSISGFFKTGFKSLIVALPVIPLLVRNLVVEGVLLSEYDLQFFGIENVPAVLRTMASFVINSDYGFFPLLFLFPLIWVIPRILRKLPKLNSEVWAWIIFSAGSLVVFLLYPTDQPRLFAFMIWLLPIMLLLEFWDRDWDLLGYFMIGWMILIFGAIQYSSTAWLVDMSSSYLIQVPGLLRNVVPPTYVWVFLGYLALLMIWLLVVLKVPRNKSTQAKELPEKVSV